MKLFNQVISILLIVFVSISCDELLNNERSIEGSGNVVNIQQQIEAVSQFEFSHALQAVIVKGTQPGFSLMIDDNLEEYLIIEETRNKLNIGLENGNSYSDYTFRVNIIVPEIEEINGSGAISADVTGFETPDNVNIVLSGASKLDGELIAAGLNLMLSGASSVNLFGSCNVLNLDASGASSLLLSGFESENVYLYLSGASIATIYSNGKITADLSGASILSYMGDADIVSLSSSGASVVEHISGP